MFKDFSYSEQSSVNNYIDCFDINNDSIDFDTLDTYKDSEAVLNAQCINDITATTTDVQESYNNQTQVVLDEYADTFQSYIDRLKNVKEWQSGSQYLYYKNDIVKDSNNIYFLCIADTDGTQPLPTNNDSSYWVRFELKGNEGMPSWGLTYIGAFNWENTNYNTNDVVYVKNEDRVKYFVCISGISYTSAPSSLEDDTQHWKLLFEIIMNQFVIVDSMPTQLEYKYMQPFGLKTDTYSLYDNINIVKEYVDDVQDAQYLDLETAISQVYTEYNGISLSQLLRNILLEYNL